MHPSTGIRQLVPLKFMDLSGIAGERWGPRCQCWAIRRPTKPRHRMALVAITIFRMVRSIGRLLQARMRSTDLFAPDGQNCAGNAGFLDTRSTPYTEVRNRIAFLVALFQHGKIEVNSVTQRVHVEKFASAATPNYSVPVVAYRVSDDDGSRPCAITVDGVQQWVDEANRVYAAAGITFAYDGALLELRDTQVNNLTGEDDPSWQSAKDRLNQLAAQHRSVVVVHRALIGGGFSW